MVVRQKEQILRDRLETDHLLFTPSLLCQNYSTRIYNLLLRINVRNHFLINIGGESVGLITEIMTQLKQTRR